MRGSRVQKKTYWQKQTQAFTKKKKKKANSVVQPHGHCFCFLNSNSLNYLRSKNWRKKKKQSVRAHWIKKKQQLTTTIIHEMKKEGPCEDSKPVVRYIHHQVQLQEARRITCTIRPLTLRCFRIFKICASRSLTWTRWHHRHFTIRKSHTTTKHEEIKHA